MLLLHLVPTSGPDLCTLCPAPLHLALWYIYFPSFNWCNISTCTCSSCYQLQPVTEIVHLHTWWFTLLHWGGYATEKMRLMTPLPTGPPVLLPSAGSPHQQGPSMQPILTVVIKVQVQVYTCVNVCAYVYVCVCVQLMFALSYVDCASIMCIIMMHAGKRYYRYLHDLCMHICIYKSCRRLPYYYM